MANYERLLEQMRSSSSNVRFIDLEKVCTHYFGQPRLTSGSHVIFKTPWIGNPRINIQNFNGKAKPYQVRQTLLAIDKLFNQNEH
jgi:hypothetical protein